MLVNLLFCLFSGGFEAFRSEYPAMCMGQNENQAILSFVPPPKYRSCSKVNLNNLLYLNTKILTSRGIMFTIH